jgi:radical SAM protein with 4Fe4S-binding SPASM domain
MLHGIGEALTLSDETFDVHVVDRIFDNSTHQVRGYTRCHWQAFKPVIGADGNVFLCAQKRTNPNGVIGNILQSSFAEVWTGEQRRRVVDELDLRSCPFCVHDKQNKTLEFVTQFTAPHASFF